MSAQTDTGPRSRPAPAPVRVPVPAADVPRRPRTGWSLPPPWSRAPLLPFGQPAVLLAVLAAAAILACAGSSAPLFLSSASSASLARLVGAACPEGSSVALRATAPARDEPRLSAGARPALAAAGQAPPLLSMVAPRSYQMSGRLFGRNPVLPVYRPEALANVARVAEAPGVRGVWVSQEAAGRIDARLGDTVQILVLPADSVSPTVVDVRIAGLYRNMSKQPPTPYWCNYRSLIYEPVGASGADPAVFALATDPAEFARILGAVPASMTWESRVDTRGMTLTRSRELSDRQSDAYRLAGIPEPADFGRRNGGAGQLPALGDRAALVRAGLRGPVLPIALGGTLLALLLLGAAGSYWADRRHGEIRLLSVRGVGPAALAGKAVLELALPAALGTALGWLLAGRLVRRLGPSPALDPSAPRLAALVAAVALAAGLALLAAVAALRCRHATERPIGARRSRLALLPYELVLLAGAGGCWLALRGGSAVLVVENIAQVSLLVVLFPLLFIVGGSVLVVRLLGLLLPLLARRAGRLSPAWFLAASRLTASRLVGVLLLAAAATPVAMAVYAAGLTTGSASGLEAKARVFTGADAAVLSNEPIERTAATDRAGTVVVRYLYGQVGARDVAVLGVDPDTFAGTAYWRPEFAGRSLPALLDGLRAPPVDGRLAALVVDPGRELAGATTADVVLGDTTLRVTRVSSAALFPGRRLPVPIVVVDRARLAGVDPYAGSRYELWTDGPVPAAQAAVLDQDLVLFDTIVRSRIFDAADYVGITWTFGYLTALAGLVGLVAVGALLLYVETRQRSRVASYALGRRMGLTRATHLRSLLAELGLLLALAWATGTTLAWVALGLVHGLLDVDPARPPGPALVLPAGVLAGSAAAAVLVAGLTAGYAQRIADRTLPAEILRLGT